MEYGVFSIGDRAPDPQTGQMQSEGERIHRLVRLAEAAEQAGFDVFAVGEHHNPPFVSSSQAALLGFIAARTSRITLSTATTLITTNDPVRLAEEFASLQHLSHDRVDLVLGRGNTPPVFDWFGQKLEDRWTLSVENRQLLARLWTEEKVDWEGRFRTPLEQFTATPRPLNGRPPFVWQGTAGSPQAAQLAAAFGDGFFVNNLFGPVTVYAELIAYFREQWRAAGRKPDAARIGAGGSMFIRESSQDAKREFAAYYNAHPVFSRVGNLEHAIRTTGSIVGSPAEAVDRILEFRDSFGSYHRQLFNIDLASIPERTVREVIDLSGSKVLPALRQQENGAAEGERLSA